MEKTPSPAPVLLPPSPDAAPAPPPAQPDTKASPRSKAEEEGPPLVGPAMASLGGTGSSNPGLSGTQPAPCGGSGVRKQDLRLPKRRTHPGKRYQCSGDGCRLACRSMKELLDHMQVHYRPTQSLEGKTFRCSTLGCVESFPDMQSLMGHVKVHYKPNRYFKCENCMARFRTHRSLFKHLHSCSDVGGTAAATPSPVLFAEKPTLPPTSGLEKEPPEKLLEELPKLQSVIQNLKKEAILPDTTERAPAPDALPAGPQSPLERVPLTAAHPYPLLEQSLFGPSPLARFSGPAHTSVPGAFLPYVHGATYNLPQAAVQSRLRPFLPTQGLPVSNAVWKKSQGHSSNSRIVWEHTRGRYNCLQCSYTTASREEVTQHVEDHRKNPSPPSRLDSEIEFGVGLPSFHQKLTPEVDNPLFSPL
uniref:Zinc finger protein 414 n=1 Tax=Salvator merianae TaxID=96440 RepID=A0A8D0DIM1_SALMN